jgi:asparagine synthase (glutamine-hydrolysing)
MCGIAGIVLADRNNRVSADRLHKMCAVMEHRGPDDEGIFVSGNAGLAMRRLSIIDVAGGHQPIANETGDVHLVCNGEIYNHQVLRSELESRGHRFRTDSDVEVILHLYEELGADCVQQLRGMFAFALWDGRNRRLILGRDRLGKKPLFYRLGPEGLTFGSEIRLLRLGESAPPEIDHSALSHYLSLQYVPSPQTIYKDVAKLPPAHVMTYDSDGAVRMQRYWQLSYEPKTTCSLREATDELERLLDEAVRIRLMSEVPLGVFLSGGIDSAVVTALTIRHSSDPVRTFAIGFQSDLFDEAPMAEETARILGSEHQSIYVKPDFLATLPELVWHFGEPFADPSALPMYYLCREARQSISVALGGDGGDEAFAGYSRYALNNLARLADHLPNALTQGLAGRILNAMPDRGLDRSLVTAAKHFAGGLHKPGPVQNLERGFFFGEEDKAAVFTDDFKATLGEHNTLQHALAWYDDISAETSLDRTLGHDVAHYLADDLLVKADIASMSHSLELRAPFLDHVVMEFAAQLPANWKLNGLRGTKHILKLVASRMLPHQVVNRRKRGFSPPVSEWFRDSALNWLRDILLDPGSLRRGYFNADGIENMIQAHVERRADHGKRLWALVNLELWHRVYMDGADWTGGPGR